MTRPDKVGEASMEEILASIRKIIAEDPTAPRPKPDVRANGQSPPKAPENTMNGEARLEPRLSMPSFGAPSSFEPTGLAPASPASSRPPFDDDLADLLEESRETPQPSSLSAPDKAASADVASPRLPELASDPQSAPSDDQWAMWRTLRSTPSPMAPLAGVEPQNPPAAMSPPPTATAAPVAAVAEPAVAPPFARRSSFYPPRGAPSSPTQSPDPAIGISRYEDATPVPGESAQPESAQKSRPVVIAAMPVEPVRDRAEPVAAPAAPAPSSGPTVIAAMPIATPANLASPSSMLLPSQRPLPFGVKIETAPIGPSVSSPEREVMPGSPAAERASEPTLPKALAVAETIAADATALNNLAAGLAAATSDLANPYAPFAPPAPVASAPASFAAPPVRTLEDAIADMVRPMLQKWITDNMPRIVEKALRVEQNGHDPKRPGNT